MKKLSISVLKQIIKLPFVGPGKHGRCSRMVNSHQVCDLTWNAGSQKAVSLTLASQLEMVNSVLPISSSYKSAGHVK
jgi:hypothetical protein